MLDTVKCKAIMAKNAVTKNAKAIAVGATVLYKMGVTSICTLAEAQELIVTVIKVMGLLAGAVAVFLLVWGLIAYAEAYGEGDGPAKSKAQGKLIAAGVLAIVTVIIEANAENWADMIKTKI